MVISGCMQVEYRFYNRRPEQRLSRQGFEWFQARISGEIDYVCRP